MALLVGELARLISLVASQHFALELSRRHARRRCSHDRLLRVNFEERRQAVLLAWPHLLCSDLKTLRAPSRHELNLAKGRLLLLLLGRRLLVVIIDTVFDGEADHTFFSLLLL